MVALLSSLNENLVNLLDDLTILEDQETNLRLIMENGIIHKYSLKLTFTYITFSAHLIVCYR